MSTASYLDDDAWDDRQAAIGDELADHWETRRHRAGGDGRSGRVESARQRTIIVTFPTPAEAAAWDAAGQPLDVLGSVA